MFKVDGLILIAGILLLLGIASSKVSSRLGMPVLVLFLLLGMLAGSEGIGGIAFDNYRIAHAIGTVALAIILFDGGLSTSLSSVGPVWKPACVLATSGVLITATVTGIAASWILGISLMEGLLLGSIVGSTDAAAVFSVLRSGGVSLSRRLSSVLEVESASNDPMAIFMTIGCIEVLLGNRSLGPGLLGLFAAQMILGTACGLLGGFAGSWLVNRIELGTAGLYPVLVSACCLLTFGVAAEVGGSGFLAVYLAGIIVGNRPLVFQRGIRLFHDAAAWLSQIVMFVVLGLLCFPSRLLQVAGSALLISAVLILVARPVAVLLSATWFRFSAKELAFISWVGLKGAVPITLATFPLMLRTPQVSLQADLIFDVVFFTVVVSAVIQGMSLTPVARRLGLERPRAPEPPVSLEINSLRHVQGEVVDYTVDEDSRAAGRQVKHLGLPEGVVIAVISRGDQFIPPQGGTLVLPGDHVIAVLRPGVQAVVNRIFRRRADAEIHLPMDLEFPLRAGTRLGELQELYDIPADGDGDTTCTLREVMLRKLGTMTPALGDTVQLGKLQLRVRRLDDDGEIDLVGMSIVPGETESPKHTS